MSDSTQTLDDFLRVLRASGLVDPAKIDQALGAALAGLALWAISFPPKAKPGSVPVDVLFNLVFVDGILATIPGLIAAVCYARYKITRARYDATKAALAARKAVQGA